MFLRTFTVLMVLAISGSVFANENPYKPDDDFSYWYYPEKEKTQPEVFTDLLCHHVRDGNALTLEKIISVDGRDTLTIRDFNNTLSFQSHEIIDRRTGNYREIFANNGKYQLQVLVNSRGQARVNLQDDCNRQWIKQVIFNCRRF